LGEFATGVCAGAFTAAGWAGFAATACCDGAGVAEGAATALLATVGEGAAVDWPPSDAKQLVEKTDTARMAVAISKILLITSP
jgi:hypothetical protein